MLHLFLRSGGEKQYVLIKVRDTGTAQPYLTEKKLRYPKLDSVGLARDLAPEVESVIFGMCHYTDHALDVRMLLRSSDGYREDSRPQSSAQFGAYRPR